MIKTRSMKQKPIGACGSTEHFLSAIDRDIFIRQNKKERNSTFPIDKYYGR